MNEQETFDNVALHLLKQGKKAVGSYDGSSYSETVCKYRSKDGLKCAVGCLIPDEMYDPLMEGHGVDHLLHEFYDVCKAAGIDENNKNLLKDMQLI